MRAKPLAAIAAATLLLTACTNSPDPTSQAAPEPEQTTSTPAPETAEAAPTTDTTPTLDLTGLAAAMPYDIEAANCATQDLTTFYHDPAVITEYELQLDLNRMLRQKVITTETQNYGVISETAVSNAFWMLDNHPEFEHADTYRAILNRIAAGDFSQVLEDYNTIADLIGPPLELAQRAATAEEEAAYFEDQIGTTCDLIMRFRS